MEIIKYSEEDIELMGEPIIDYDQNILETFERGGFFENDPQIISPIRRVENSLDFLNSTYGTFGYGGKTEEEYFKLWEDISKKKRYLKNKFGIYYPIRIDGGTICKNSIIGLKRNDPNYRFKWFGEKYIRVLDANDIEELDKLFKKTLEFYGLDKFPEKDLCIGKYYDKIGLYFRKYWVDWFRKIKREYYKKEESV